MLIIRPEQMEALAQPVAAGIKARIIGHLQQFWPEEYVRVGAERVAVAMDKLISVMRQHGIVIEHDVRRCADLAFALEDFAFHAKPWAQRILRDADYPPRIKVNLLWQAVQRRLAGDPLPDGADVAQS